MSEIKYEELSKKAYDLAYDYDLKYGCCPQCVLLAVQETVGIVSDDLIKASHTMSGGGGLLGNGTCGALAGGLLALGAKFGREKEGFGKGKFLKSFKEAKELQDWFIKTYGTTTCDGIQKKFTNKIFNMWDPNEIVEFKSSCCKEECADISGKIAQKVVKVLSK